MNVTAALLGLALAPAQPPAPDYYPLNSRNIKLPIEYKQDRKAIRQVLLFVSRNGENVWTQEAEVLPNQDAFVYTAREDGVYWFKMVIVDLQGKKDPPDVTVGPPDLKALVDTVAPAVRFTNARRTGDEVVVEWAVEEKYPDDAATKVFFRPAAGSEGQWQEVTLPAGSRSGVRFPPGFPGGIVVKIVVQDLAGTRAEGVKEVGGANPAATTSLSPGSPAAPVAPPAPPPMTPVATTLPTAPGVVPPGPLGAHAPGSLQPAAPGSPQPFAAAPPLPAGPTPIAVGHGPSNPPAPMTDPRPAVNPAGGQTVIAVGAGTPPPAPTVEMTRAQAVNYLRFDLNYEIEQRGPSGISRVDLYVTRDDGRTWGKWSQHDGRELPVKVTLDARHNTQPEGQYGFRLVPVSGAGLSDAVPVNGDAPDLRVVVDVTPPVIKLFEPVSDPTQRDTLLVLWEATDRNFADDPILVEWAEHPSGPWRGMIQPVGDGGVMQVGAAGGIAPRRMANSGRYPWRVPTGLPPRVYIKVSARDAAGNLSEVVTPQPILVDLAKPRAKIQSIGSGPVK